MPAQLVDVGQHLGHRGVENFRDFVADPLSSIRRIYDHFGFTLSAEGERRMRGWIAANPQFNRRVRVVLGPAVLNIERSGCARGAQEAARPKVRGTRWASWLARFSRPAKSEACKSTVMNVNW